MKNNKKWGFKDYIALWKLSLREYFWRIDGRQAVDKVAGISIWFYLGLLVATYLYPIYAIFNILTIIRLMLSPILGMPMVFQYSGLSAFSAIIYEAVWAFGPALLLCNIKRLKYNLKYKSSIWYKNTGVTPSEIVNDKSKGLYGEYIATISAEQHIKTAGGHGKIYNNVIVPTNDGLHAELDIVAITETGIHVIEAKARTGAWSGNITDKKLIQNKKETDSPIFQNVNHISYLYSYLYSNLPECPLKYRYILDDFVNVVLFTLSGVSGNFNYGQGLVNGFIGMATTSKRWGIGYDKYVGSRQKCFTKEEIDLIAQTIEPCTGYSKQELDQLQFNRQTIIDQRKREREIQREAGIEREEVKPYYIANVEYPSDGGTIKTTAVCRDNIDGTTWFYDERDKFYKAIPIAKIVQEISIRYKTEAEAMACFIGLGYKI